MSAVPSAAWRATERPGCCPRCDPAKPCRRRPGALYCPMHEAQVRREMVRTGYLVEVPRTKKQRAGEGDE